MTAPFLLTLPRLHAELAPQAEGCLTLWPGLPRRPEHAWAPAMPWSESMAASCLADYERAGRDGASGSPVVRSITSHQRVMSSRVFTSSSSSEMPFIRRMDSGPSVAV